MIAMIFEFWFDQDRPDIFDEYLHESQQLRAVLAETEGCLGVERFASCATEGKFVAIGFFTDEDAVRRWRNRVEHRRVQALGRTRLFTGYRLRMAEVVRDYGSGDRSGAPADSRAAHG